VSQHPSSGVLKTVTAASGTGHNTGTATSLQRGPTGHVGGKWKRLDLQEVGCGYMDWIGLAQDRDRWRKLVSAVMNLRLP